MRVGAAASGSSVVNASSPNTNTATNAGTPSSPSTPSNSQPSARAPKTTRRRDVSVQAERTELEQLVAEVEHVAPKLPQLVVVELAQVGDFLDDVLKRRLTVEELEDLERIGRRVDGGVRAAGQDRDRVDRGRSVGRGLELVLKPEGHRRRTG